MSAGSNRGMSGLEWLLLFALALLWSGVFFLTKIALTGLPPFTVVVCRLGFGALFLHIGLGVMGLRMPLSPRLWGSFLVMGALNNLLPFSLIAWGQTEIASGLAAILNATTPLFTVLLAHLLTRDERVTAPRVVGVLLGLGGVVVMIGPGALRGLSLNVLGEVAILGAAVSYALAGIFGRRFRSLPPMLTATGQVTAGALLVAPFSLLLDRPWSLPTPGLGVWAAVLAAALFCTALAYALYFRILATAGATNLLLVTLLMPAGALLLGMVLLDERLGAGEIAGMGLIALGLVAIDGRFFQAFARGWARA